MLFFLAALPLLLPQEPSSQLPPFDPAKAVSAAVLEEEIDRSLRWLRTRFDPAQGSYGSPELSLIHI